MLKILIVDDEKMIREGLVHTMPWNEMGFEVAGSAPDGQTALEMIRELQPHAVMTDIRMPKMDGLELLRQVSEAYPQIRVVIMSGYDDFTYAQQAIRHGVFEYLVKPVDAAEVQRVMQRVRQALVGELRNDLPGLKVQKMVEVETEHYALAVRTADMHRAQTLADWLFSQEALQELELQQVRRLLTEMADQALHALSEDGYVPEQPDLAMPAITAALVVHNRLDELHAYFTRLTRQLVEAAVNRKDSNRLVIRKAVAYIDAHFRENLTVQRVADAVLLSPNYFSHVFKKVMKESFTDYLNRVRIEEAKKLMKDPLIKVYEVSDRVGYSDYKYFSTIFKKIVGVTPSEYTKTRV